VLGRKTFEWSLKMGATFGHDSPHYIFSRHSPPKSLPTGVEFLHDDINGFVSRLRAVKGKNIWLMGGGALIASFLDASAIDELIISVVPTLIGEGIPLIAPRHRDIPLLLKSSKRFPDGVVQLHYIVRTEAIL
jgi:dihydrofolate reductase